MTTTLFNIKRNIKFLISRNIFQKRNISKLKIQLIFINKSFINLI